MEFHYSRYSATSRDSVKQWAFHLICFGNQRMWVIWVQQPRLSQPAPFWAPFLSTQQIFHQSLPIEQREDRSFSQRHTAFELKGEHSVIKTNFGEPRVLETSVDFSNALNSLLALVWTLHWIICLAPAKIGHVVTSRPDILDHGVADLFNIIYSKIKLGLLFFIQRDATMLVKLRWLAISEKCNRCWCAFLLLFISTFCMLKACSLWNKVSNVFLESVRVHFVFFAFAFDEYIEGKGWV